MIILMVISTTSAPLILLQLKLLHTVKVTLIGISRAVGVSFLARFVKNDGDGYYLKYSGSVPTKATAILVEL